MKTIKTVTAAILFALIVIFFINALAPYSTDGVMDATFFSKNDRDNELPRSRAAGYQRGCFHYI